MTVETANDLVIIVPGILGSRLVRVDGDDRTVVWDLRAGVLPRTLRELHRMGRALRAAGDTWAPSPDDGIVADALLSDPAWLPGFFGVDGYTAMTDRLRIALGERLLTYPYDWRLSNADNAERLRDAVLPELEDWRKRPGRRGAKLIFVCHSMGGLLVRYFCEHLGGAADTRQIITFGTPYRGSMKALAILANGKRLGSLQLGTVARALPSVWELLPQYPCVGVDGTNRHPADAGLDALDDPRFAAARMFHARIREPVEARAARGEACPYRQTVLFGRIQSTVQFARREAGRLRVLKPGENGSPDHGGDGTVPSFASFPIEWDSTAGAIPLLDKHAAMPGRAAALENLVNELAPADISGFKAPGPGESDIDGIAAALDVPTDLPADGVATVRVVSAAPRVVVELTDHLRGDRTTTIAEAVGETDPRGIVSVCRLGPLPEGSYTVVARTPGATVSDHFVVWDPAEAAEPDEFS